jgi:hypothetical protein
LKFKNNKTILKYQNVLYDYRKLHRKQTVWKNKNIPIWKAFFFFSSFSRLKMYFNLFNNLWKVKKKNLGQHVLILLILRLK